MTANAPVETFYSNIPEDIRRFHRISSGILKGLLQEDTQQPTLDHIYIAASNAADYQHCAQLLRKQNQGQLLNEHPNFNGRRFSTWKLNRPWVVNGVSDKVAYAEMGEPKPGQTESNRISHIAYRVGANLSGHPAVVDILNGQPKTVETADGDFTVESARIDTYGGLKLKIKIDQMPFEIELRRKSLEESL